MSERSELIAEANDLGLTFKGNISNIKLKALVAAEYATSTPPPVDEVAPAGPTMKVDESGAVDEDEDDVADEVEVEVEDDNPESGMTNRQISVYRHQRKRAKIAEAKRKAFETCIVTITNKDNRENDVMTTVYLSFENQHFGISKLVPLDIPVELERSLINIAANCTMTLHKDEIVDGRRTGNKVPTTVKKYAISYSRQDPS